jgi:hypothetical protein
MSRKLLLFLDPETNEVMTQFEGQTVSPVLFPYQVTRYAFFDESFEGGEKNENDNDNDARARLRAAGRSPRPSPSALVFRR